MNINTLIREIEKFQNTKFIGIDSLETKDISEGVVAIKNTETDGIYAVPFEIIEEGIVLKTSDEGFKVLEEPNFTSQYDETNKAYKKVSDQFFISESKKEFIESLENLKGFFENYDLNDEPHKKVVQAEKTKIKLGVFTDFQEQIDFIQNKNDEDFIFNELFEADNEIKVGEFQSKSIVESKIFRAIDDIDTFEPFVESYVKLKTDVAEKFDDETAKFICENIDFSKDLKIQIPVLVTNYKNTYNEDIKVVDTTKSLNVIVESLMDAGPAAGFNMTGSEEPKFLKYHYNKFSPRDVDSVLGELELAMKHLSINEEDLMFINGIKNKVDMMRASGKICDQIIFDAITSFNNKFAKDDSAQYVPAYSTSGAMGV